MKHYCPVCLQSTSESNKIIRNGSFFRSSDSQQLQKYHCKPCNKYFSAATNHPCFAQKKRRLNDKVKNFLVSGVSMRRMALLLNTKQETIKRKMSFLANQAQTSHEKKLEQRVKVMELQFDDMETFEHTKLKPVSITLCVEKDTRKIIGFGVSQIAAKGRLAALSVKKYGKRKSNRKAVRNKLFEKIQSTIELNATIESDQDPHYPSSVRQFFPQAKHLTYKGRRGCVVGQGELKSGGFDPLFSLNHTAAMLRANMNRLFRRTWCTSKTLEGLINHLWIYTEFHNNVLTQPLTAPP